MREGIAQLIDREWLQQIVVDAAGDEIAIEADVIDGSRGDPDRPRFADFRERVDVVERVGGFAEVDERDVRAGRHGQRLYRFAQPSLVLLLRGPAVFDGDGP